MPLNKSAYIRYRIIDQCLTNTLRKHPTKEDIRDKIEEVVGPISVSSLEKDFGKMKEIFGAPIQYDRANGGYYYTEEDFSIKEFPLTQEEISALDFSTSVLQVLKNTPLFNRFEAAIEKVISGYRVTKVLGKTDEELIQVESPLGNSGAQWIEVFYRGIIEHSTLIVDYKSFRAEPRQYMLCPYLLKEYRNRWYVAAYSIRSERTQVFALDRVQNVTRPASNQREHEGYPLKWVDDKGFDAKDFFEFSFGVTQLHGSNPEMVELSFNPQEAAYILSQPLHHSQELVLENEEEVRVRMRVYVTKELIMTILSYGAGVRVIGPASLVETIRQELDLNIRSYKA